MSTHKIVADQGAVPHGNRRWVRVPHEMHKERLRKRAGRAYVMLGKCNAIARILGLDHSRVARRRQGIDSALTNLLIDIDQLEREGVDTSSMDEAIILTRLEARRAAGSVCVRTMSNREQELDHAEEVAQHRFLANDPNGFSAWAESLAAYIAHAKLIITHGRAS